MGGRSEGGPTPPVSNPSGRRHARGARGGSGELPRGHHEGAGLLGGFTIGAAVEMTRAAAETEGNQRQLQKLKGQSGRTAPPPPPLPWITSLNGRAAIDRQRCRRMAIAMATFFSIKSCAGKCTHTSARNQHAIMPYQQVGTFQKLPLSTAPVPCNFRNAGTEGRRLFASVRRCALPGKQSAKRGQSTPRCRLLQHHR